MEVLSSKIFDIINGILHYFQSRLDVIRRNSFILTNIDWCILFSIIAVYVVSIFQENNITGVLAVIVPILVVLKVFITEGEKVELEKGNFYLIIYLLICFISNLTSSMPVQSFYGYAKTILYIAFYFSLCQFLKKKKIYAIVLIAAIALLVAGESILGLFQNISRVANIATWQDTSYLNPEDVLTRVYGTLKPYNPNLFGGWLVSGISTLIAVSGLLIDRRHIKSGIVFLILFLISALCLFYTGCRGAYIAFFAIIMGLILVLYRINKQCKIFTGIITALGTAFVLMHQGIMHRLMSIFIMRGDSSTSFRMNVYHSAVQMFQDNPVFGVGVGNKVFREIYGLYMLSGFDALSCYSVFLEMAVESGIFSLIAYLLFVLTLLYSGYKKFISSKDRLEKILLFTGFISIIAVMIHGLVDTIYFRPQVQFIFWTMAAILTTLTRRNNLSIK